MGPRSSIGSPVTFMIRPRVPGPTGTMMGDPVSDALLPRTRPSVPIFMSSQCLQLSTMNHNSLPSIAMHRTTFSPKCCYYEYQYICNDGCVSCRRRTATSRTSLLPPLSVTRALRMGGSLSVSNFTVLYYQHPILIMFEAPGQIFAGSGARRRRKNFQITHHPRRHQ